MRFAHTIAALTAASVVSVSAYAVKNPFVARPTDTKYGENQTVGRYLYTGNVPKILKSQDVTLYLSKVMLTMRVKAWISDEQFITYPAQLLLSWNRIRDAFLNDSMSIEVLPDFNELAQDKKLKPEEKATLQVIARYYGKHNLENFGENIYESELAKNNGNRTVARKAYKEKILLALLRSYLQPELSTTPGVQPLSVEQGLELVTLAKAKNHARLNELFPDLLIRQLGKNFTPLDQLASTEKRDGYKGYLTFVYPIAATVKGPYDIDPEGVYFLGQYGGDEARWHSFMWNDEFGGFPFIPYTSGGVAFHGPISTLIIPQLPEEKNTLPENTLWFLNRHYVSHGCHRMDSNDILELRTLLPDQIVKGVSNPQQNGVQVVTKIFPDWDYEQNLKVVYNVDYYNPKVVMKPSETVENAVLRNAPAIQKEIYLNNKISKLPAEKNGQKTLKLTKNADNTFTMDGLMSYTVTRNSVQRTGIENGGLLKDYPFRGTRILQYREEGVKYDNGSTDDKFGKFPPVYFNTRPYAQDLLK